MCIDRVASNRRQVEIDLDEQARSLLRSWHFVVRALPHLVSSSRAAMSVRGLVAWYETVVEIPGFSEEPPLEGLEGLEGLDSLIGELVCSDVPPKVHRELARARRAVGVAEELVRWRKCLRTFGEGSFPTGPATDRLELALEEARRRPPGW